MQRRQGFTLIELLIVIAIIGILAAMIFPVFESAQEKARQTTCAGNERQIGLAILEYTQDNNERYPTEAIAYADAGGVWVNQTYQKQVDPYMKTGFPADTNEFSPTEFNEPWFCPDFDESNNTLGPGLWWWLPDTLANNIPDRTYALNWWVGGYLGHDPAQNGPITSAKPYLYRRPLSVADVATPSQTVLVAETRGGFVHVSGNDTGVYNTTTYPGCDATICPAIWAYTDAGSYVAGRYRHSGGANYLFADCHVKWAPAPSTPYKPDGVTPVEETSGVVYSQKQFPNALGWFRESAW